MSVDIQAKISIYKGQMGIELTHDWPLIMSATLNVPIGWSLSDHEAVFRSQAAGTIPTSITRRVREWQVRGWPASI